MQMSRSGLYTTRPPYLVSDSEESGVGRVNEQSHLPCGDPPLRSGGCDPRAPCEIRLCHGDVDQGPTLLLTDAAILATAGCGSNSDLQSLV